MLKTNLFSNLFVIVVHFWPIFASSTSSDEDDQQLAAEPKIVYVDGMHAWDNCDNPALKRSLSAITGLLLSHPAYGSAPYNASRNCFLTIAVPVGYRLRLKALDFDVQGKWRHCEQEDTLHLFDHYEGPLGPRELAEIPVGQSPGRLMGEFCGKPPEKAPQNAFVMAESTHNALTLWWHTEPGTREAQQGPKAPSHPFAEGFRLLWSAFRHSADGQCQNATEFACEKAKKNSSALRECLPAPLACNGNPDCADASDLDPRRQLALGKCQNLPLDPLFSGPLLSVFGPVSGPKRLLLCASLALLCLSICMGCCCCWLHCRRKNRFKRRSSRKSMELRQQQNVQQIAEQPMLKPKFAGATPANFYHQVAQQQNVMPPPTFSPPQVPAQAPPPAPKFRPHRHHQNLATNIPPLEPHKLHHSRRQQQIFECPGDSGGGGSSSSSSQQRREKEPRKQLQQRVRVDVMNNHQSSTTTATTSTSGLQQQQQKQPTPEPSLESSEYFYVQHHHQPQQQKRNMML